MKNKYLGVTIFLVALIIGGGVYVLSTKQQQSSQVLQTNLSSDNIEPSAEPVTTQVSTSSAVKNMENVTELIIEDEKVGTGAEAVVGKKISVNYTGALTDGTVFDSNVDPNFGHVEPFTFTLGASQVIEGWDKGFDGMKVGGKRKLTIPSSMAYGDGGVPGAIPGGATLVFEVELLGVE